MSLGYLPASPKVESTAACEYLAPNFNWQIAMMALNHQISISASFLLASLRDSNVTPRTNAESAS